MNAVAKRVHQSRSFIVWLSAAIISLAGGRPSYAQFMVRTTLPWRTIETEHFAFHYPVDLEDWTRFTAAHVEAIDAAVSRVVGYTPPHRVHVVVDDPYETSNGSAWPYLNVPIINLWASPPDPREDIGEFRQWGEMLVSHEFTHIAHLTRPSRNGFTRQLWESLPVDLGLIATRSPRWVIEGYATYVEGRVTGSGRPHGVWRAAFLRKWALDGTLPSYDRLDAPGGYAGGEFAYLAGSAFLEWLVARGGRGDSILVDIWRRLTARQDRSFDEAFSGVFGESARALYGRFTAELTGASLDVERAVRAARVSDAADADSGAIVQRLAWGTGDPAISHDGRRVALVLRSPAAPSRVVVWGTAPEPDTGRARRDSILLKRDPEDVPARSIYPPPKRVLASLRSRGGAPYEDPRFLRDGRILLWRFRTRADGSLVSDAYLWDVRHRSVQRVTRDASVRDLDPLPDGRTAIATRCRLGRCDLVRVDLETGAVTTIEEGTVFLSFYRPRVSPDGLRAVIAVHSSIGWRLGLVDLATGKRSDVETRSAANAYDASWSSPTTIVFVSDEGGINNVYQLDLSTGSRGSITQVTGAAVAPETNPADSSVWFLSLYSRGYDVRRIARTTWSDRTLALNPRLAPAIPLQLPPVAPTFAINAVSPPRAFGLRPRLFRWIPVGTGDADGAAGGLALTSSDVIGRSELLAKFAAGAVAQWRGGAIDATWRGTRPSIRLQGFAAVQNLDESRADVPLIANFDTRLAGGLLAVDGTHQADWWSSRFRIGVSDGQLRLATPEPLLTVTTRTDRELAVGDGAIGWALRNGPSTISGTLGGNVTIGRSVDRRFDRGVVSTSLGVSGAFLVPVSASALYGVTSTDAPLFEQFGIGGGVSPLLDRTLLTQRIAMPVLPTALRVGSSVFTYRALLNTQPLAVYLWGGSTTPAGERFSVWNRVLGLDYTASIPAFPLAGTPAARAQLGVGESLDAPFRRKVRAYAGLVIDP
jgi:hypothetical protein